MLLPCATTACPLRRQWEGYLGRCHGNDSMYKNNPKPLGERRKTTTSMHGISAKPPEFKGLCPMKFPTW